MKRLDARVYAHPTPVWVVGSYGEDGRADGMVAAWGGVVSSQPARLGVSIRPSRQTYANIMAKKAFSICVPDAAHTAQADYLGIASGKDEDKFAATGLTAVPCPDVDAPYVAEFPLAVQCRLTQTVEVGVHVLCIGEGVGILAAESILDDKDRIDVLKADPFTFAIDSKMYHRLGEAVGKAYSIGLQYKK